MKIYGYRTVVLVFYRVVQASQISPITSSHVISGGEICNYLFPLIMTQPMVTPNAGASAAVFDSVTRAPSPDHTGTTQHIYCWFITTCQVTSCISQTFFRYCLVCSSVSIWICFCCFYRRSRTAYEKEREGCPDDHEPPTKKNKKRVRDN